MRLFETKQAPFFSVNDIFGKPIDLIDFKGQKVWISFFRGASCPFCNLRMKEIVKYHNTLVNKQVQVITFFADTTTSLRSISHSQLVPFPIVADSKKLIYSMYGLEDNRFGMIKAMARMRKMVSIMGDGLLNMETVLADPIVPADFLIDEKGNIKNAYYGADFGDHLPIESVLEWALTKPLLA